MRKLVLLALVSIVVVGMPASPAASGGWWTFVTSHPSLVAPGMTVRIKESGIMLSASEVEAVRTGGAFYVYVIEDFDRRRLDRGDDRGRSGELVEFGRGRSDRS